MDWSIGSKSLKKVKKALNYQHKLSTIPPLMSKKYLIPIFLLFVCVSTFAACGGKSYRPPVGATIDDEMRRCVELSRKKKFEQAVDCLEVFKSRHAGSEMSATAELYIADNFFRLAAD